MLLISILTTVDNTVKECKLMNMHCKKKKNSYWVCSIQPAYCRSPTTEIILGRLRLVNCLDMMFHLVLCIVVPASCASLLISNFSEWFRINPKNQCLWKHMTFTSWFQRSDFCLSENYLAEGLELISTM